MDLADELRPKSLDELIGQDHVKPAIRKFIDKGCRRWLFHGQTGTGKTSLALIVAHELRAHSLDLLEINAATLGVEELTELVDQTRCYSMNGEYRVIILDEAQALSEQAKSVLLKPLEDSGDSVNVWILCTMEVTRLHRALRDRCTSFALRPMGSQDRQQLVERAAKHLGFTNDTKRFLRELDAKEVFSARDILRSFEKFANDMSAEDALA